MIVGDRVYLDAVDAENAETFRGWLNDPQTHRWLASGHLPISKSEEQSFLENLSKTDDERVFQVHLIEDDRLVGLVGLQGIDHRNRNALLGVAIGSPGDCGQGYGTDAIKTCLRAAFDVLGLHSISLHCHAENERGVATYRSLGFTETGRISREYFVRGRSRDAIVFDILEDEFRDLHGVWEPA